MQTIRATKQHLREGSTGGELISAVVILLLSSYWYVVRPEPGRSILFTLIAEFAGPSLVFIFIAGAVHVVAWTQPDRFPFIPIRKGCSCVELAIWVSFLYDLYARASTGGIVLILPFAIFLVVAIRRRTYATD